MIFAVDYTVVAGVAHCLDVLVDLLVLALDAESLGHYLIAVVYFVDHHPLVNGFLSLQLWRRLLLRRLLGAPKEMTFFEIIFLALHNWRLYLL